MGTYDIGFGPFTGPMRVAVGTYDGTTGPRAYSLLPAPNDVSMALPTFTITDIVSLGATGVPRATVSGMWSPPQQGEGPIDLNLVGYYELATMYNDAGWTTNSVTDQHTVVFSNVPVGTSVQVRVRAVSNGGYRGPWKVAAATTSMDVTPPPVPSTPRLISTVRGVSVIWDGTFVGGAARPPDFAYVRVEVSLSVSFALADIQQAGQLLGAGMTVAMPVGTAPFTVYAHLIAVDTSLNASVASNVAQADSMTIVAADITGFTITSDQIADLTLTSRVISPGAVNVDKIAQNAVTSYALAPNAVQSVNINDFAVSVRQFKSNLHLLL